MFEPVIFLTFSLWLFWLMIFLWLETHDVFLRFFLLFNSVTFAITAYNVGVLKKTWDDTWLSFLTSERSNSKHQSFSTTCKHHNKIINQRNGKFVAYTPCLKCHAHNNLTELRRVYVGLGSLVCIINLQIAPVDNVLMRLGCQGKET